VKRTSTAVLVAAGVAVVAAIAVGVFVLPSRSNATHSAGSLGAAPSTDAAGPSPTVSPTGSPTASPDPVPSPEPYAEVAAFLRAKNEGSHVAVSAIDLTTGVSVAYNDTGHFHTASIVKVDILASLLLEHQHSGTWLTGGEQSLATRMITQSDNDAADALWQAAGGLSGIAAANKQFKLTSTQLGPGGDWGNTRTTTADQLQLLRVVATAASPLTAKSRAYELGLMKRVESDQRWGVPTAAAPGATVYVKNGWYPFLDEHGDWSINSLGIIVESGHTYLVATLSDFNDGMSSGTALVGQLASVAVDSLGIG
jgi:beta-lactamase class A